jgi:hypothetical protein
MSPSKTLRVFNDFRGARYWASRTLGVSKKSVSQWLTTIRLGGVPPAKLFDRSQQLADLAQKILATDGKCITHVGEVENARTAVIRERRKRRAAK